MTAPVKFKRKNTVYLIWDLVTAALDGFSFVA
jgi:hypothetical protein